MSTESLTREVAEGPPRRRQPARDAILRSAARQFAEHGFKGASLREILRDAGANVAAAHYHFGSKEELYREVVSRYLVKLCAERERALADIEASKPGAVRDRVARLVRAYVEPHLRLCSEPEARSYVQLLARFTTEHEEFTGRIYSEILEPTRTRYLEGLAAAMPELPRSELNRLFGFIVSLMVTAPADSSYRSLTGTSPWPKHPQRLAEQITCFATAGILAAAARARSRRTTRPTAGGS